MHLLQAFAALLFVIAHLLLLAVLIAGLIRLTLQQHKVRNQWRQIADLKPLDPPFAPLAARGEQVMQATRHAFAFAGLFARQIQTLSMRITTGLSEMLGGTAQLDNERMLDPLKTK